MFRIIVKLEKRKEKIEKHCKKQKIHEFWKKSLKNIVKNKKTKKNKIPQTMRTYFAFLHP